MNRTTFLEDVSTWPELLMFCGDIGYDTSAIYDNETRDEEIESDLRERAYDDCWQEIRDWLYDLCDSSRGDYWRRDDYGDWYLMDNDDFEAYKNDVLEYADDNELFDAEDEDEDDWSWEPVPIEPPTPPAETGVTLDELFTAVQILSPREIDKPDEEPSLQILF